MPAASEQNSTPTASKTTMKYTRLVEYLSALQQVGMATTKATRKSGAVMNLNEVS